MTTVQAAELQVVRRPERFLSDDRRVIARFFAPGDEGRIRAVIGRVMALSETQVEALLKQVYVNFRQRHKDIEAVFTRHYNQVSAYANGQVVSDPRKQLIGAYFTMEYSFESAALFNPSIVPHPNQRDLPGGAVRFLMSLRATGEGHVSSIVFRTGIIDKHGIICFDPPSRFARRARQTEDRTYDKHPFFLKLIEMGAFSDDAEKVIERMPDQFRIAQLSHVIDEVRHEMEQPASFQETAENMLWLARSNYHLELPPQCCDPSEIVIFPTSENESKGIEDVRLVQFTEDDGSMLYYGTYTAYNGFRILPQIIETIDFTRISVHTLNGRYVQNKGMALFPRRVNGWYMMVSRLDGENMYLMRSENVHFWNDAVKLAEPTYPWEFVQIGNCGSPIETDAGWLLLTHGVGPMRQYCIGVNLLDRNDPSKVIGHLKKPLLVPTEQERDGYVPNVVYSCGAMIHHDTLFIPYAMSDSATSFATVKVPALLDALKE